MNTQDYNRKQFILASKSPRRLALLNNIGIEPAGIIASDVDEILPIGGDFLKPYQVSMYFALCKGADVVRQFESLDRDNPPDLENAKRLDESESICHGDLRKSQNLFDSSVAILAFDTIVVCDDEIIGKPKDEDDAYRILSLLRGRTHEVYTGCYLANLPTRNDKTDEGIQNKSNHSINQATQKMFYDKTIVTFSHYEDDEIWDYIGTGSPMDKAGAYGIQTSWRRNIIGIDGSMSNVIGLPLEKLQEELGYF
ncbi:MAG: Maf family protein [Clostridiales Family XIII bacterium]|nr:Maf family protein [Clostridiales Family XIII bacterium]